MDLTAWPAWEDLYVVLKVAALARKLPAFASHSRSLPVRIIALCPVFSVGRTLRMSTRHSRYKSAGFPHFTQDVWSFERVKSFRALFQTLHELHKIVPVWRGLQFFPQSFNAIETLHCRSNRCAFGCLIRGSPLPTPRPPRPLLGLKPCNKDGKFILRMSLSSNSNLQPLLPRWIKVISSHARPR